MAPPCPSTTPVSNWRNSDRARVPHRILQLPELAQFRTQLCEAQCKNKCSDPDQCSRSHCLTWQRRNPYKMLYSPTLCPDIEFIRRNNRMTLVRRCTRGRTCPYAHSKEEELYHPMVYKTKMCKTHPNCRRFFCPFAHTSGELRNRMTAEEYGTSYLKGNPTAREDAATEPSTHCALRSPLSTMASSFAAELPRDTRDHWSATFNEHSSPRSKMSPASSPTIITSNDFKEAKELSIPGNHNFERFRSSREDCQEKALNDRLDNLIKEMVDLNLDEQIATNDLQGIRSKSPKIIASPKIASNDEAYEGLWHEIADALVGNSGTSSPTLSQLLRSIVMSSGN